ncbi:MAG: biopolymer transporter ExbD [Gemmatimonadota bacterium]
MPRTSVAPEAAPSTDINVLPLIDVLLVLIIVFLLLERELIYIPAEVLPPTPREVNGGDGQIVLELKGDGSFAINGQPIPAQQLAIQLSAIFRNRPTKLLFLRVSPDRSYQEAITAMDVARGAGVELLAWMPLESAKAR